MQKNKGSLPHFYFFKIFMMALHVAMNTPLACKQPLFDRETGAVWSPNRGCLTIKQGLFAERTGIPCFSADSSLLSDQRFIALRPKIRCSQTNEGMEAVLHRHSSPM